LRSVLRTRVTVDGAKELVRRRLGERETNFLTTARATIFANPASPYRPLFALAGCEFGDLQQMVRARGLETSLRALRDAGVYLTFEEFKGRTPVMRNGRQVTIALDAFRNPAVMHHLWIESGGSTGQPTRTSWSATRASHTAVYIALRDQALGLTGVPKALWRGVMPAELNGLLSAMAIGDTPVKWFTPMAISDLSGLRRRYPMATYLALALMRAYGAKPPWPEHVPLESAHVVARWAAETRRTHGGCYISATSSMALRICLAAKTLGLDLTGVTLSGGGEPLTAARVAAMAGVGAMCRPGYFCAEIGPLGMTCANPCDVNEQHFLDDSLALVQVPRSVRGAADIVNAFSITTILPESTNIFVNLELDDFGVVETRRCGCLFGELGLTRHLRQIRSFGKLTGEGVSLVATDVTRILEEVLPATFGGTALDYQLAEEEDERGFTRLTLRVSPRLRLPDDSALIRKVLETLAAGDASADYARAAWQTAGTLRVARVEPEWTSRGKLPPLVRRRQALAQ
jgi:hypothetical protein